MPKNKPLAPPENETFLAQYAEVPEPLALKKIVFASDFHVPHHDKVLFAGWRQFLKDEKPDEVILGGDVLDLASVSSHGDVDPPRLLDEIAAGNDFLDDVQSAAPNAVLTYLEGNHEARLARFLGDEVPTLQGVCTVPELLHFERRGIATEPYGSVTFRGRLGFTHGFFTGDGHAAVHARRFGANVCYGHTHRPQSFTTGIAGDKVRGAFGQGCMCPTKNVPYIKGRPSSWMQSFFVAYVDERSGDFFPYTVLCNDSHFVWNNKVY